MVTYVAGLFINLHPLIYTDWNVMYTNLVLTLNFFERRSNSAVSSA
jgi:hypothetical protein